VGHPGDAASLIWPGRPGWLMYPAQQNLAAGERQRSMDQPTITVHAEARSVRGPRAALGAQRLRLRGSGASRGRGSEKGDNIVQISSGTTARLGGLAAIVGGLLFSAKAFYDRYDAPP
jgi:hypothetical protein